MYRQPSRRKQLTRRFTVYAIMAVSIGLLVTVLLFIVLGYQLNRSDGRFEQGGLVQFDSLPGGAAVNIDGTLLGTRTATKSTLSAGNHRFVMTREGYRSWQKTVTLAPGAVLWLNYARLIPTDIRQENIASFGALSGSLVSPNAKWIAVKDDPAVAEITLVDISRTDVKQKKVAIPGAIITPGNAGKTHSYRLMSWDASSRYVLLQHLYNETAVEWLILDTEDSARSKNISMLLNVAMTNVVFSKSDSNVLYAQTDHDVRKVDINAATISRPLIANVAEFEVYDRGLIVFTSRLDAAAGTRVAGYYEDGAERPRVVRTVSDNGIPALHMAIGEYFGESFLALAYGDSVEIRRGRLPAEEKNWASLTHETTLSVPGGTQYVAIRKDGRFVISQKDNELYVYDNELKRTSKTTVKGLSVGAGRVAWLDDYMFWSGTDGTLRLYEFDGENQNDIMPVIPGQAVTLGGDDMYLYGFTIGADGARYLTRVRMILP